MTTKEILKEKEKEYGKVNFKKIDEKIFVDIDFLYFIAEKYKNLEDKLIAIDNEFTKALK
jgi:hypothetical protein